MIDALDAKMLSEAAGSRRTVVRDSDEDVGRIRREVMEKALAGETRACIVYRNSELTSERGGALVQYLRNKGYCVQITDAISPQGYHLASVCLKIEWD